MPGFGPQASVRSRYFSCKIFKAPAGGEVVAMKFADESGAAAAKTARKNQGAAQHGLREGETGKQVESPIPGRFFYRGLAGCRFARHADSRRSVPDQLRRSAKSAVKKWID